MPIETKVHGVGSSAEYEAALSLATLFQKGVPAHVVGQIDLCPNLKLPGQKRKDIDLLVVGVLKGAAPPVEIEIDEVFHEYPLNVASFAFVIEVKDHTTSDTRFQGNRIQVRYSDGWHDATEQASEEMYSVRNYSVARLGESPRLCHFVWMRNLAASHMLALAGGRIFRDANALPQEFTISQLFRIACSQNIYTRACAQNGQWWFNSFSKNAMESLLPSKLVDLVAGTLDVPGEITRKRVELISSRVLQQDHALRSALGSKLVVFAGRAGTGKTIRMLQAACELATKGKRCLFLAFNRALVQDLRRLLYHADVPDVPEGGVRLFTLYEFVKDISAALGLLTADEDLLISRSYFDKCQEIAECIRSKAVTPEELAALAEKSPELLCWDNIFIDEAQDCDEAEKALLFSLFHYRQLVIADGIDQFTRGIRNCDWQRDIYFVRRQERLALRQKRNLAVFCNGFADAQGLKWKVEPQEQLTGGKVYICREQFPFELLHALRNAAAAKGATPYDMLFLVPSIFTKSEEGFTGSKEFQKEGFKLWDGTRSDVRIGKTAEVSEHRLLQYNSCRGLEGWSVICLAMDEHVRYTRNHTPPRDDDTDSGLELLSEEERLRRMVGLNTLIPLTRAIDTLVITIKDWDSEEASCLKDLAARFPDFVFIQS